MDFSFFQNQQYFKAKFYCLLPFNPHRFALQNLFPFPSTTAVALLKRQKNFKTLLMQSVDATESSSRQKTFKTLLMHSVDATESTSPNCSFTPIKNKRR